MALAGFMGRVSCGLAAACATCARVDHSGDTRMPGAGKPTRPRAKKPANATELHENSVGTVSKAEVCATELHLTPAAAKVARYAKLEKIGLDAIVARMSEQGQSFRMVAAWLDVPTVELWAWIRGDVEREHAYNMAVEAKAHTYVEEAHALADRVVEGELDPRRADVKIKLSQWSAARTQAYQERKTVEHTITHRLDPDDLKQRLAQLVDVAGQRAPQQVIEADYTIVTPIEADNQ